MLVVWIMSPPTSIRKAGRTSTTESESILTAAPRAMAPFLSPSKSFCPVYFSERPEDKNRRKNYYYFTIIIEQIVQAFLIDYPDKSSEKVEIIFNFIFTGIVEAFWNWFTAERKMPLKELEETLEIFTFYGIKGMVYNF